MHLAEGDFSYSADCWALSPLEGFDTFFLWAALLNKKSAISEEGFRGAGIKHLDKDWLLDAPIEAPSLIEQKTIGLALKHKISEKAALVRIADATIAELKAYRAALISEAVTGKLEG